MVSTSGVLEPSSSPIIVAPGTNSWSRPSSFVRLSVRKKFTPVTLPPGRLRLVTSPKATGSLGAVNTIGIEDVAALAARVGASPPLAKIAATGRRTNSAAMAGSRSYRSSAQRYSIATVLPSTNPLSLTPLRNEAAFFANASADPAPATLSRARRYRPCRRRAAEKRDEIASSQSIE
jgi:hypothetical protein